MIAVVKPDQERPPMRQVNVGLSAEEIARADGFSERREKRTGNRFSRSDILREAIFRGLNEMEREEKASKR